MIGTLQALEVIKIALQMVGVLSSKLLLFNGETTSFRTINLRKKVLHCPVCGNYPSITELIDYEHFCGAAANDKVTRYNCNDSIENTSIQCLPDMQLTLT